MWACEFNFAYSLFIFEITIHKCILKWLMSFFFIKTYCPHIFMLFILSSISVNMFDIVTKYDLRQPCKSRSPRRWNHLTHRGRVTHICVSNLTIIGSDNGSDIINWTLMNKLRWNLNRYSSIFIQEIAFGSVVWEMVAFLSQPHCVLT